MLGSRKGLSSALPTPLSDGFVGEQRQTHCTLVPTPRRLLELEPQGWRNREEACLLAPWGPPQDKNADVLMLSYLSLYYRWVEWERDEERLLTTIYKRRREREEWSWATFPAKMPPHSSPDLSTSISLLSAHPTPLPPPPLSIQCSRRASSIHITWEPVRNQKLGPTRVPWSQNLQFSRTPGDPRANYSLRAALKNQRRCAARRLRLPWARQSSQWPLRWGSTLELSLLSQVQLQGQCLGLRHSRQTKLLSDTS